MARSQGKAGGTGKQILMRRVVFAFPVIIFAVVAFFLFRSLYVVPAQVSLPSVLIDKPAPAIALQPLDAHPGFTRNDLASGHVTVVNFFGSWCVPCRMEGPELMKLSKRGGFVLYGVSYKDKPDASEEFLNATGNPFAAIVADPQGLTGIDWGVTAAPETYVIDGKGVIRFKYNIGPLTPEVVEQELVPAIEKARQSS
jgi:cytochrome c biogenesis protein CcmG/thiol:disulfide interchange protein DsbE